MVCLPIFEMQPNCVIDVAQSLIVGFSLAVTAQERRAGDIESLRIAFDDNRQRVVLHGDIVLRKARSEGRRILLGMKMEDKTSGGVIGTSTPTIFVGKHNNAH